MKPNELIVVDLLSKLNIKKYEEEIAPDRKLLGFLKEGSEYHNKKIKKNETLFLPKRKVQ